MVIFGLQQARTQSAVMPVREKSHLTICSRLMGNYNPAKPQKLQIFTIHGAQVELADFPLVNEVFTRG